MKSTMNRRKKYLIAGGLLLLTATPSFALFGIGDIVFDPTSYASLVQQATTALNQLKMIENNIAHFSIKQQWQTTLTAPQERQRKEYVRRDQRHEHGPQQQCTVHFNNRVECCHRTSEREYDYLSCRTDTG